MARKAEPKPSLSARAWAAIAALGVATTAVSGILFNVVGARDAFVKLLFPDHTVGLVLSDAFFGPMSGTPWSNAFSGSLGFDVEFVLAKSGPGAAHQCTPVLRPEGLSQTVDGAPTPDPPDKLDLAPGTFEIGTDFPQSRTLSARFYLPDIWKPGGASLRLRCAELTTESIVPEVTDATP